MSKIFSLVVTMVGIWYLSSWLWAGVRKLASARSHRRQSEVEPDSGSLMQVAAIEYQGEHEAEDEPSSMPASDHSPHLRQLLRDWAWQVLLPLGGQRFFVGEHGFENESVVALLDAERWFKRADQYNPIAARSLLKQQFGQWQQQHDFEVLWQAGVPPTLHGNVAQWQKLLSLSEAEVRVLIFSVLLHTQPLLVNVTNFLGELNGRQVAAAMAQLLRLPEADVRKALGRDGQLFRSGLVKVDNSHDYALRSKIDLMSGQFSEAMVSQAISPLDLLKRHIQNAPKTELSLADFTHMGELITALQHYVPAVLDKQQLGCNILVYGVPGTGKTEFARALAQDIGVELFEVAWADEEGNPADREARMSALRAAQHIFAHQRMLLLFDEIEDVFEQDQEDFNLNKAWLNRMLENNSVPTIWISNRVDVMDRSVLRRFDVVMEMKAPPRRRRQQMIADYAETLLSEAEVQQLAEHEAIVPAMLERAHKVTETVAPHLPEQERGRLFKHLLHNTLKAQGISSYLNTKAPLSAVYDLQWLNTQQDLAAIADGLQGVAGASLCLYGPPGTGKSAYVKWLADRLNKPLLYKRGSDLLSKYVGESEQLIAAAFEEAQRDGAVLIFDEVDSFLQDRRQAARSWEVTQVNEMLTQMEAFQGLFVATTNLIKQLDQAALRRFDFKIEFGYLKPEQGWSLFAAYCANFGLAVPDYLRPQLARLTVLTPGDFAVAAKRARVAPFADAEALLALLKAECALKEDGQKGSVGFM